MSKCRMCTKNHIWLKQKTRPRINYEWIGKTIWKKSDPKNH